MTLGYTILYYNKKLLDRYEKRVPKTWDEVIETSLEIKEKEKKKGNINLSEYNGLFSGNSKNLNIEQMIVSSPPRFFTKMYNHYLKESRDNLNRSF